MNSLPSMSYIDKPRILIVAPFAKPEMTSWLILKAFHDVGIQAEKFDYRTLGIEYGIDEMNAMLRDNLSSLPSASVVLIIKGDWIKARTLFGMWHLLRALWIFDFDSFQPHDYLYQLGRVVSLVFLMCEPWVEKLRSAGINAHFLPQATDSEIYRPVPTEKLFDVGFIGSNKPGRAEILERIRKKFKLGVWGEDWQGTDFKPGVPAYLENFSLACSQSKILLNITASPDWPIYPKTFSQRIYMAASCSSCILTDEVPGIEEFFSPSSEILTYKNETLISQISNLLSNEDRLSSIGEAARRKVLIKHQYFHRLRRMFLCLGLLLSVLRNSPA